MVDQNVPHQLGGDTEKVSPVLPLGSVLPDQTKVRLVNQRGALQGVVAALALKITARHAAQLAVNKWDQGIPCVLIAMPPVTE